MDLTVYLAGEILSSRRDKIEAQAKEKDEPLTFVSPQTHHDLSDDIGDNIIGDQTNKYYRDDTASSINNLRTQVLMNKADVVIALFGEEYKQWNTAMDATTAINSGKPLILVRPEKLIHPLKEISNKANIVTNSVEQTIEVLEYIYK